MRRPTTSFTCDALLFDLDGVLVDSTECIERSWRAWAGLHGLDADEILRVAHGRRAEETVRIVAPQLDAAAELAALVAHEARATEGIAEVPGAAALLHGLPADRWAVVTSGVRAVAEHRLRFVGLPIPRVMVCADEVSRGKPDPEGYLAAAARLEIAPASCIVVEDAPPGLAAARAAGMRAVAVATTYPAEALRDADAVASALGALIVRVRGTGATRRLEVELSVAATAA